MLDLPTEPKRLLSHVIAEWACALKYEHLSPAAIQAANYFGSTRSAAYWAAVSRMTPGFAQALARH